MKQAKKIAGALLGVALTTATSAFAQSNCAAASCGGKNAKSEKSQNANCPLPKKGADASCGGKKAMDSKCGADKNATASCGASKKSMDSSCGAKKSH